MDTPIQLAREQDFALPASIATQASAFVGKRGSGKTYAAGRLVEELYLAGVQVVVLDGVGNWFGLRLKRDGVTASQFDIPILGGHRGDVALLPDAGAVVARSLVETGSSAVLDVSLFRKEGRKQFATAFAEELLHLKKTAARKTRLCLVIEEAQLYIPQATGRGQEAIARMVGAFEDLVKLGRNYGIGVVMLSQRPQAVNKEVLNQAELLLAFQMSGKHERDAIGAWVSDRDAGDVDIVDDLPSLGQGEAFAWSPSWLRYFGKIKIREKRSFDASATPSEDDVEAGTLKPLDLGALAAAMREVEATAAENDPRKLKARIAELEAERDDWKDEASGEAWDRAGLEADLKVTRDRLDDAEALVRALQDAVTTYRAREEMVRGRLETFRQEFGPFVASCQELHTMTLGDLSEDVKIATPMHRRSREPIAPAIEAHARKMASPPRPAAPSSNDDGLKTVERKLLTALAQSQGTPRKRDAWLILANLKPSGDVSTAVGRFNREGWITTTDAGTVITAAGLKALGPFEPLPRGRDLRVYLLGSLPAAQAKILQALFDAYPRPLPRAEALAYAGLKPSGDVSTAYGKFRKLGWIRDVDGGTVASKLFFER